jgi:hypothetical protein
MFANRSSRFGHVGQTFGFMHTFRAFLLSTEGFPLLIDLRNGRRQALVPGTVPRAVELWPQLLSHHPRAGSAPDARVVHGAQDPCELRW